MTGSRRMLAKAAGLLIDSGCRPEATDMTLIVNGLVRKPAGFLPQTGSRWFRVLALIAATVCAAVQPQAASAWPCRWRAAHCGFGYQPFCPTVYGYSFGGCGFGSYGFSSYRSYSCWTPGLYSGWSYPFACGWYPYSPVIYTPAFNCYPSAFAPVYGPAGVLPFMGFGATASPAASVRSIAAQAMPKQAVAVAVRPSNGDARLRAGRLLAAGDRHLRSAVDAPAKLAKALDAYRRAATIAPDQPDTYIRQAIVLTALNRGADAAAAIDRAVATDARLGADPTAAVAAAERLPPVPAFDAPPAGATALAARSTSLIGRIFKAGAAEGGGDGVNWIADRWSRQWQRGVEAVAQR